MTQEKDCKIDANLLALLSNERQFLFAFVQSSLHELVKSEVDRYIDAPQHLRDTDQRRIRNRHNTPCFRTHIVRQ